MNTLNKRLLAVGVICVVAMITFLTACQKEEEATIGQSASTTGVDEAAQRFQNDHVVTPSTSVLGNALAEWGARWWKWAYSFPCASSPLLDETGAYQNQRQSGLVFFLAGAGGGIGTRSVTIPRGKFIFFPVLTYINDYPCPDPNFKPAPGQTLEQFLAQGAKEIIDQADELFVELDGYSFTNLENYRGRSPLFNFIGNADLTNCVDACITGNKQQAVTDGYWMMLTPLSRGNHTLRIKGGISAFGFSFDLTYYLKVQ